MIVHNEVTNDDEWMTFDDHKDLVKCEIADLIFNDIINEIVQDLSFNLDT